MGNHHEHRRSRGNASDDPSLKRALPAARTSFMFALLLQPAQACCPPSALFTLPPGCCMRVMETLSHSTHTSIRICVCVMDGGRVGRLRCTCVCHGRWTGGAVTLHMCVSWKSEHHEPGKSVCVLKRVPVPRRAAQDGALRVHADAGGPAGALAEEPPAAGAHRSGGGGTGAAPQLEPLQRASRREG